MDKLKQFYYEITAFIPRPMPKTEVEYAQLKEVFTRYYKLDDDPKVWATLAGHITSTEATKVRKSYRSLVNACRRLEINRVAMEEKKLALEILRDQAHKEAEERILKVVDTVKKLDQEEVAKECSPNPEPA